MSRSAILAVCIVLGSASSPCAQGTGNVGGSATDLLTTLGLATNVPEAKEFVQHSRPAPETFDYRSTYAKDYPRPRARTAPEVEALKRDLERAGARNRASAGQIKPTQAASTTRPAKPN